MLDENDNYLILKKIYLFTIGGCVGCGKNVYECLRSMGGWVAKKNVYTCLRLVGGWVFVRINVYVNYEQPLKECTKLRM